MIDLFDIGPNVIVTSGDKSSIRCRLSKCGEPEGLILPSKITMLKNAMKAGKDALLSGFKQVSEEEQKRRHLICESWCEFYRHKDDRCSKCGCFTTYKSRLEAWHCPIDKW